MRLPYLLSLFFIFIPLSAFVFDTGAPTFPSKLNDGDIFKISVDQSGIFKMDYQFIKTELGVDIDNKDPRNIQLLGLGGALLPEFSGTPRPLDIPEVSISIMGEADGKFDQGDFILFYSPGPDHHYWDAQNKMILQEKNIYSRTANYFLKFGNTKGKRIISDPVLPSSSVKINQFLDFQHIEEERINLLASKTSSHGSGKKWFGDYFKTIRSKDYSSLFKFPSILLSEPIKVKINYAARCDDYTSAFLTLNNNRLEISMSGTNTADVEDDIARETEKIFEIHAASSPLSVKLDYPNTINPSEGWLDYININTWNKLEWTGKAFHFSNPRISQLSDDISYFINNGNASLEVWNVSDQGNPKWMQKIYPSGGLEFTSRSQTNIPEEFFVFNPQTDILKPKKLEKIKLQNLHGIENIQSIIVYHPDFEKAATKLASHRTRFSKLSVVAVSTTQIFNEFGSGQPDPTAIRDFAKYIYSNNLGFRYLTLIGDASFNYLGINTEQSENFIPVFETEESMSPLYAFPSDDFYGLLGDDEGSQNLSGDLDIGIGRIPVRNEEEANILIDKIIGYDTSAIAYGDWRQRIVFSADDEDANTHLEQAESISQGLALNHPEINLQKIYLDAYKQEFGSGGEIIPGANAALNQDIFQGILIFNYLGHGGYKGLSQEGLLLNTDVINWSNKNKLPLVITATCSFAPFDDPAAPSAGEGLFRNKQGGAIALLTTVRNVYSSSNELLTRAVFDLLLKKDANGKAPFLGDVMRIAKNNISNNGFDRVNARKFALIGDPCQQLSIPALQINTKSINQKIITTNSQDTVRALETLEINGQIAGPNGKDLSDFDGNISVTLFDKKSNYKTLGQNTDSYVKGFQVQNSILFKGNAEVKSGKFTIQFVVPKDINYNYGAGKISYYANSSDGKQASGFYNRLIIGGTKNQLSDNIGPDVKPYINHFQFKDGDLSQADPLLLVNLFDENGINSSGNSIGHDLVAVLDGDTKNQFVLNNFYESIAGNYKKGIIRFPLKGITPGMHEITVKAWDVANNPGIGKIRFEVVGPKTNGILSLNIYPNPIKDQFSLNLVHNLPSGTNNNLKINILDLAGRSIFTQNIALNNDPIVNLSMQLNLSLATGLYLIQAEIWNENKRIDMVSKKVLRTP